MKNSQEKNKEYAKWKKTLFLKQIAITAAICFSTIWWNANFPDNKDKLIEKNTIDLREAIIKKSLEYIKNDIKDSMLYDPFCMYTIYYSNAFFEKTKESKKDNHYIFNQINKNLSQENKKEIISYIDNYFLQNNLEQSSNKEVLPLNIIDFWKSSTEKNSHQDAIDLYSQVGTSIQSMSDWIVLVAEKWWTKENIFSTSSYKWWNTIIIYNPKNSSDRKSVV